MNIYEQFQIIQPLNLCRSSLAILITSDLWSALIESIFLDYVVALKRAVVLLGVCVQLIRRIRTGYDPASSGRTRRPWRWRSCVWRARSKWLHHGWHSRETPSVHHEFLHKSTQRSSWHHHAWQVVGLLAWWFPGCCLAAPCGDVLRLPFRVPFLLFRVQTWWQRESLILRYNELIETKRLMTGSPSSRVVYSTTADVGVGNTLARARSRIIPGARVEVKSISSDRLFMPRNDGFCPVCQLAILCTYCIFFFFSHFPSPFSLYWITV